MLFPLFFLFGFSIPSPKTTYGPLSDHQWSMCDQSTFITSTNYRVNYTYCSNGWVQKDFIEETLRESSDSFFRYLKANNKRYSSCRRDDLLEIYEVSQATLNDASRFHGWQKNNPNTISIWGLFDSRDSQPGLSAITITNQGEQITYSILAHEMAHYWVDRLCVPLGDNEDEHFAKEFEYFLLEEQGYIIRR